MTLGGLEILVVEPGTAIEHDGEEIEVTDANAVRNGRRLYMTQRQYEALKAFIGSNVSTPSPRG